VFGGRVSERIARLKDTGDVPDPRSEATGLSHLWERQIPAVERPASRVHRRAAFGCLKTKRLRDFKMLAWGLQRGIAVSN